MRRSLLYGLFLGVAALAATSCSSSDTTVIQPSPTSITEPDFTGTLNVNGAVTLPFGVTQQGQVTATITKIDPNPDTATVGMALGISGGITCQAVITNETSGVGTVITGQANASGLLCARLYDNGTLTGPVSFTVQIVHY